jgi:hypothetical protein
MGLIMATTRFSLGLIPKNGTLLRQSFNDFLVGYEQMATDNSGALFTQIVHYADKIKDSSSGGGEGFGVEGPWNFRTAVHENLPLSALSTLSEALDVLISTMAPGPPYFDSDLRSVTAGNYSIATAQLCHALLHESYYVQSVAGNLWDPSVAADAETILNAFTITTTDQHGHPLALSLTQPHTWQTLAISIGQSDHLKDAISTWAELWFIVLPLAGQFFSESVFDVP